MHMYIYTYIYIYMYIYMYIHLFIYLFVICIYVCKGVEGVRSRGVRLGDCVFASCSLVSQNPC